jgi:hypothetical protein
MPRWIHLEGLGLDRGMSEDDLNELFAWNQKKFKENEELENRLKVLSESLGLNFGIKWEQNPKYYEWNGSFCNNSEIKVVVIDKIIIPFDDLNAICSLLLSKVCPDVSRHYYNFLINNTGMLIKHPYSDRKISTYALAEWVEEFLVIYHPQGVHFPIEWEITTDYTQGSKADWAVQSCFADWVLDVNQNQ